MIWLLLRASQGVLRPELDGCHAFEFALDCGIAWLSEGGGTTVESEQDARLPVIGTGNHCHLVRLPDWPIDEPGLPLPAHADLVLDFGFAHRSIARCRPIEPAVDGSEIGRECDRLDERLLVGLEVLQSEEKHVPGNMVDMAQFVQDHC
jgi:hypothetical protein